MSARGWWTRSHGWWWWLLTLVAIALPLARLWPLDGQFGWDWVNHEWLSAYTGQYLRVHGGLPVVLNTGGQAGMAYPVFYGTVFYPLLGLFTAWLSPDLVIRLAVTAVTALQLHLVTRALVRVGLDRWPARGVACLTIWAIYPLTNLYNRAAITEYVAVAFLTSAFATWFLLIHAERTADRVRLGLGFGLLFVLTAGTHPITALYSLPILLLLLVAAYHEHGASRTFWLDLLRALIAPALLVVVVLAPWLYVVRAYKAHLEVNHTGIPWFYKGIDAWTTRFSPIPLDPRTSGTPLADVENPYIDAQLNLPLLILVVGAVAVLGWRHRDRAIAGVRAISIGLVTLAFFLWISIAPASYEVLPRFARMLQIAYRAISYQNLAMLLALFMLVSAMRRRGEPLHTARPRLARALFAACLALAITGVAIKWTHASAVMTHEGPGTVVADAATRRSWAALPYQFYGLYGYATPGLFEPLDNPDGAAWSQVWIPIGERDDFGEPLPLTVTLATDTWVGTSLQAFPWNTVSVDGIRVPPARLRVESRRLVVRVPAGTHVLALDTEPDPTWIILRRISFAMLALGLVAFASLAVHAQWSANRRMRA